MGTVERQHINQKAQAVMKGINMSINAKLLSRLHHSLFAVLPQSKQDAVKEMLWNNGADYDDIEWDDTFDQYFEECWADASFDSHQF